MVFEIGKRRYAMIYGGTIMPHECSFGNKEKIIKYVHYRLLQGVIYANLAFLATVDYHEGINVG